ncbi:MAG: H-X9-DG-CTERM domain-containing protein [Akkermansiaceae bacterium]
MNDLGKQLGRIVIPLATPFKPFPQMRVRQPLRFVSRGAFTLPELLVVIAIIAVLAAFSLPLLLKVREKAQASECASNLRQLGVIASLYTAENNGELPRSILPAQGSGSWVWYSYYRGKYGPGSPVAGETIGGPLPFMAGYHQGGIMSIEAYHAPGARHIFNCPSNKRNVSPFHYVGYVPNRHLMVNKNETPARNIRVANPSRVILLADHNADGPEPNLGVWNFSEWDWARKIGFHRHAGKANVLFLDGSVRTLTADDIDPLVHISPPELRVRP